MFNIQSVLFSATHSHTCLITDAKIESCHVSVQNSDIGSLFENNTVGFSKLVAIVLIFFLTSFSINCKNIIISNVVVCKQYASLYILNFIFSHTSSAVVSRISSSCIS